MKQKRTWLYILGSVIVVVALVFVLRSQGVSFLEIKAALGRFRWKSILLASLPIIFIQLTFQITRLWAVLPSTVHRLPLIKDWPGVARAFSFGQAINSFAPARAGDALKLVMLQKESLRHEVTLGTAAGMLLSDKAIDLVSFITLCLFCLPSWGRRLKTLNVPSEGKHWVVVIALGLVVLLSVVFILFPKLTQKLKALWSQMLYGLRPLRAPMQFGPALLFSMVGWCGELLAIRILCNAQGYPLRFNEILWSMVVLNIGVAVPISLANLGAFEAAMTFGLIQVGLTAPIGLAVASAHHALQIVCVFLWAGVLAIFRRRKRPAE